MDRIPVIRKGLTTLYWQTEQEYNTAATSLASIYRIDDTSPAITSLEQQKAALENKLDTILFRLSLIGVSMYDVSATRQEYQLCQL